MYSYAFIKKYANILNIIIFPSRMRFKIEMHSEETFHMKLKN